MALISGLFDIGWQWECVLFSVMAVASTWIYWNFLRPNPSDSEDPLLNNRMARLVGTKTILVTAISSGVGKVQISDALWTVECENDLPEQTPVEITGYRDSTLLVRARD